MTFTQLIVYGLAVWRISHLFVKETGPFGMFKEVREWTGIQHDDGGFPYLVPDNFAAQALSCIWCMSLWTGLFFTTFLLALPEISFYVATAFSLSTIAVLIETYIEKAREK